MIEIGLTDYTPDNRIINIRDKNQVLKAKYAIGKDDVLKCVLMKEHFIELSFQLNKCVSFKRSDYIEWEGDKYALRSDVSPKEVNARRYEYTLHFEAVEMFFQDIQYYYLNQDLKESEWSLTGNPTYFFRIGVDNINRYFGGTEFTLGTVEPEEIKYITFDTDTNVFDAFTQIADEYNAEWYITGKTIHLLNKVSFGDEIDFKTEVSVLSMQREEGETGKKYTRIMALGSTRNIPNNYRVPSAGEAVDAVYTKRLRIPASKGDVIDAYPGMHPDEVVEGTVIFDEVYPRRVGTIEAVVTIEYTDTDQETGEQTKWNAYKFKDSGIDFKEEYVLPGQELRISFQSGDLNGRDFAVTFHKDGFSASDNSQCFEIIRTDEYGKELPNDILRPWEGDQYVLYGFNIALVSDQYVPEGEQELYETAVTWLGKQLQDTGVYECPSVIKHFRDNQMDLSIGQKVRLIHEQFENGSRSSRVMGFEKKLYNKFDATYTVGDNSTYSRLGKIEKDVKELQHAGVIYENVGGSSVYLIKQFDLTRPTDFNAYSASASNAKYFNKQTGGEVSGDTIFWKNLQVMGTGLGDVFQNSTFTAGQLGSGFQIKKDGNGQSYMEVDNILVRREAVFNRLTISEIKSVGGSILLSLASMVVSKVEDNTSSWKCYFNNDDGAIPNDFAVGDQAICRKFTGKSVKYYWVLVTAIGPDYIELSKTDKDGSGSPEEKDEIIQLGNRTDVNRQSAIILSAYGSDSPSIKQYTGINSYDMTGKEVTVISPNGNKFTGSFTVSTNGTTAPVYKEIGPFVNGRIHYLDDRVSYLGSYWVCEVNSTIQAPHEDSTAWRKDTAGQTDIDNALDGIQIGGRNLILNTNRTYPTNGREYTGIDIPVNIFTPGETYTWSFDLKIEGNPTTHPVQIYHQNWGNVVQFGTSKTATQEWVRHNVTFIWKASVIQDAPSTIQMSFYTEYGNGIYPRVRNPKMEMGNKATDWSPAPEDVEAEIADAKQGASNAQKEAEKVRTEYKADFIVLSDKIESKVSQSDFNALDQRVSSTESSILQLPGQITLAVTESKSYADEKVEEVTKNTRFNAGKFVYNETQPYKSIVGFDTNIPLDSNMWLLEISGYAYGTAQSFKAQIVFYHYQGSLVNTGYTNEGGISVSKIRLGFKNSRIAVELTLPAIYYLNLEVQVVAVRVNSTQSVANDWIKHYGFDSTYTNIIEVPRRYTLQDQLANEALSEAKKVRTEYQADFTVLSNQISSKVSQSDFNALGQRVSNAESSILQLPDKITLAVTESKSYADEKVNGIQIGGRNYFKKSTSVITLSGTPTIQRNSNAPNGLYLIGDSSGTSSARMNHVIDSNGLWTISFDIRGTQSISSRAFIVEICDLGQRGISLTADNNWKHHSVTVNVTNYSESVYHFVDFENLAFAYLYLRNIKVEKGDRATDWSPAPEDVEEGIDKAQSTADSKTTLSEVSSSFSMTANKISLASTTIELTGTTIAKAIEAQSLNIANNLTIGTDGKLTIANGKTVLNPDGSGQFASGNFKWDTTGNAFFMGSLATPPKRVYSGTTYIDFSKGFNWWGSGSIGAEVTMVLPAGIEHSGVMCQIYCPIATRSATGIQVKIQGNKSFANDSDRNPVYTVDIQHGQLITFYALPALDEGSVDWYYRR